MGFLAAILNFFKPKAAAVYFPARPAAPTAQAVAAAKKKYQQWAKGNEVDTIAKTIWGEARGEGNRGMQAVANVIRNRWLKANTGSPRTTWWGSTWIGICKKESGGTYQFSCWSPRDPNRAKMDAKYLGDGDPLFASAVMIAQLCVAGELLDLTNGADHYYSTAIPTPYWAKGEKAIASVGSHKFYGLA